MNPQPERSGAPDSSGAPERSGGRVASRRRDQDEEPVLPSVTRDERETGWGDDAGERSDEWYRRERPPHHE